jgi:hypothetical protein
MGESLFSCIGSSADLGHKGSMLSVCIDPDFTQCIHKFPLLKDVREHLLYGGKLLPERQKISATNQL